MAGEYNYNRLSSPQDSQDIADRQDIPFDSATTLNSEASLRYSYSSPVDDQRSDRASIKSSSSYSSSGGLEKIKHGLGIHRLRRKPVGGRSSIKEEHTYETEFARIGKGWWKDQQLVDRSIRSMALLTAVFAIAIVIVCVTNVKLFAKRPNPYSTSIGGNIKSCKSVARTNTALLLVINVAATMILGMSNTYQQLVTSLKISDIKWVLQKFGDSRVGTNSPFSINRKREGKVSSWLAWLLLICTSMPVHFLANSLIGPSLILSPPSEIKFNVTTSFNYTYYTNYYTNYYPTGDQISLRSPASFVCWSAFRTGAAHFPMNITSLSEDSDGIYGFGADSLGIFYTHLMVRYTKENCTQYANQTTDVSHVETEWGGTATSSLQFGIGDCQMGNDIICLIGGDDVEPSKCRLSIRMQAAFILAGCLVVKAIYMTVVNLKARGKVKTHCLTFGDVIVASASNPELRVKGECLVNAEENYRHHTEHSCHKHCTAEPSATGDEIGHCQKCERYNIVNKNVGYPQPTIATKFKKSLVANMGSTALTQVGLLTACSVAMLAVSLFIALLVGRAYSEFKQACRSNDMKLQYCNESSAAQFTLESGGWGGFNSSLVAASLTPDRLGSEFLSFCISNGAQFIYSLLYLMLIYNVTLICQERDWGNLETGRRRLRCTIVKGESFSQDYLLQLPKMVLFPLMGYSVLTHWMLGEALQTQEMIWLDDKYAPGQSVEHSRYNIVYAAYPVWLATVLILIMTGVCWWAFTYKREGFMPQMFGSIRTCCAATTNLDDFPWYGVQWGDLGMGKQFRHAGLSAEAVEKIHPNELYAGQESEDDLQNRFHEREPLLDGGGSGDNIAGWGT